MCSYVNSEFMVTEAVVVPLKSEEEFLKTYEFLDPESVPCGPEGDRESVRGSPVVPGSALCVRCCCALCWGGPPATARH